MHVQVCQRVVEILFVGSPGLWNVEYISTYHQRIRPVLIAPNLQLAEKVVVLGDAVVVLVEYLTQVQVGCVE